MIAVPYTKWKLVDQLAVTGTNDPFRPHTSASSHAAPPSVVALHDNRYRSISSLCMGYVQYENSVD